MAQEETYIFSRNIIIRLAKPDDENGLIEFLLEYFVKESPVLSSLQLSKQEALAYITASVENVLRTSRSCSFLALDTSKNNQIIGCLTSSIVTLDELKAKFKGGGTQNDTASEQMKILSMVINQVWKDADTFIPAGYTGMIRLAGTASVAPDYQRLHLTKTMGALGNRRAREVYGCKYVLGAAMSYKTHNLGRAFGFKVVRRQEYDDYTVDGKKVFQKAIEGGHTCHELMLACTEELNFGNILKSLSKL